MTSLEERALIQIEAIDDPSKLRTLIKNAEGKSEQVAKAAFRRLVSLSSPHPAGSVEHDCWVMVHTIEELRRAEGRVWRMNRLRPTIDAKGEIGALKACIVQETDGFQEVLDYGMPELTAEAIVLRWPEHFDDKTRETARSRLASAGVDLSQLPQARSR